MLDCPVLHLHRQQRMCTVRLLMVVLYLFVGQSVFTSFSSLFLLFLSLSHAWPDAPLSVSVSVWFSHLPQLSSFFLFNPFPSLSTPLAPSLTFLSFTHTTAWLQKHREGGSGGLKQGCQAWIKRKAGKMGGLKYRCWAVKLFKALARH